MKRKIKRLLMRRRLWNRLKKEVHNNWDISKLFLIFNFELFSEFFENHKDVIRYDEARNEVYHEMIALYEWWEGHSKVIGHDYNLFMTSDQIALEIKVTNYVEEQMLNRLLKLRKDLWV